MFTNFARKIILTEIDEIAAECDYFIVDISFTLNGQTYDFMKDWFPLFGFLRVLNEFFENLESSSTSTFYDPESEFELLIEYLGGNVILTPNDSSDQLNIPFNDFKRALINLNKKFCIDLLKHFPHEGTEEFIQNTVLSTSKKIKDALNLI